MKRIVITTIAAFALFASSCKKENQPHDLFIGATLKNTNWLAEPSTSYFANRDSLQINGLYTNSDQSLVKNDQSLVMKIRLNGIGNYTLTDDQASFSISSIYGGISVPVVSYYKLDATQTNNLSITSLNIKTNIATGNFQVHFVKTSGSGDNTLNLTNGSFWIQIPAVPGQ